MNIKHQISIATLVLSGVLATGCSQQSTGGSQIAGGSQSQIEGGSQQMGSQQQVETPAPVVVAPAPAPAPRPAPPVVKKPVVKYSGGNRWTHTHPAIPGCTNSIRHTHKYKHRNHTHHYSCKKAYHRPAYHRPAPKPEVDVYALQRKLKAKGYYKGPIDGVVGPSTRSALKRFMNR